MAHFARLNENNEVIAIHVINNDECQINGIEVEELGIVFLKKLHGLETRWKQTSYSKNFRKNYAGIGYQYDVKLDAFIPPKPYASWILDENAGRWEAPVAHPTDGDAYQWDENSTSWVKVPME